ncbi:thioredoxin family protein [Anaerosalibacter bizertensis]|uniref:Thioredoxin family protein n=1 Tax=Anaerosalibacter bizertensis TaxID=932217 RepID=A0A844FEB0_9FIRM|nr:thioredoxin family protein [Anaerosalibacter bizertensis]MBV1817104.1 TM0996/MTH895 family glutaredoxin-like protein [Bacteroidales bacterium MSK.15.36]HHV27835.1 thioredoxin family protein [Tissierellia bacterium]MBU5293784.1 TM0996/MTH895 family glutaredoxin-like protein [Anaerosalibacter bizertensis]MCB5558920.1 thioredoxin family protein [Anaerosalibacter bizertensis]MCG4564865.1 thioredoxin family protein [Anaerosalibacter bizertensis]
MKIKILGTGCRKCNKLEENTKRAVAELGVDASIEKVEDIKKIVEYGVMSTPALVVDEEVKFSGRVPKVEEIKKHL